MPRLIPYLMSENAREQAQFYAQALGGEILGIQTYDAQPDTPPEMKDKVLHLHLRVEGVDIFMSDATGPVTKPGRAIALCLDFESEAKARSAFEKLAEGGKVNHPFEPVFWGALFGDLEDRYGVMWMINHDPTGGTGPNEN